MNKNLLLGIITLMLVTLSACAKSEDITLYPFLKDMASDVIIDSKSEEYICSQYNENIENIIDDTCSSLYTKILAIETLVSDIDNEDIELIYSNDNDGIIDIEIKITSGETSYSIYVVMKEE